MDYFKTFVEEPLKFGRDYGNTGIPIPLQKFSKYTNYIQKGQSIVIGGKPESGKTSMMDYVYFISIFRWWREQDPDERPKLKLIYFNMKHTLKNKIQKWLCLYLKLEYNIVMDILILINGVGKLYDLDDEYIEKINSASVFFKELFDECLTVVNGSLKPTEVFNKTRTIMEDFGKTDKKSGEFIYHKEYERMITILYIDNVDHLISESDGFNMLDSNGIKKKMYDYTVELKKLYNLTTIVVAPSKPILTRLIRETEPSYKEVGVFGANADLAIVMYNPYNENNNEYQQYPIKDLVIRGKNRFRTATIVRNVNGLTGVGKGLLFIGECGYISESPLAIDVDEFNRKIEILQSLH
jgi:hypothetical protein